MIDLQFKPLFLELMEYKNGLTSDKTVRISLFRTKGVATYELGYDDEEKAYPLLERIVKSMLWIYGGYKIALNNKKLADMLAKEYEGARKFDSDFMAGVYGNAFEVVFDETVYEPYDEDIEAKTKDGGRIGLDLGGTSVKASAVLDGKEIYSEVFEWDTLNRGDISYQYEFLCSVIEKTAAHLPVKADGVGISAAGVVIDNELKVSSLLRKVKNEDFAHLFASISKRFGIPVTVANDGDVAAMTLGFDEGGILGIALGTSEAGGYVLDGKLTGRLNELAFVPICRNAEECDEWSGDVGCGVNYLSQAGMVKAGVTVGYRAREGSDIKDMAKGVALECETNKAMRKAYEVMGEYLAYAIMWYKQFYDVRTVCLMGGVMSGRFAPITEWTANDILREYGFKTRIVLPFQRSRFAQSVFAAKLSH